MHATATGQERRLVAIFAADVEGYSRLMGLDEARTMAMLTERRATANELIARHRGRVVDTAGDSILAEFGSVVDAVECAWDVQRAAARANSALEPAHRMQLRIVLAIALTAYWVVFSAFIFHAYPLLLERGFDTQAVVFAMAVIGPAQVVGRIAIWVFAGGVQIRVIGSLVVLSAPPTPSPAMVLPW